MKKQAGIDKLLNTSYCNITFLISDYFAVIQMREQFSESFSNLSNVCRKSCVYVIKTFSMRIELIV